MAEAGRRNELNTSAMYFMPQRLMMRAFQTWQQIAYEYMHDLLSNHQILDTGGKTLEGVMQLKHQADQAMDMAISSMQMPAKSDIELVLQKLSTLESLVRDLSDRVDHLTETEHQA